MTTYANLWLGRLYLAARGEHGQSIGSFMLVVLFAAVACGIAYVLIVSGDVIGGGEGAGPQIEQPNFNPPNPLD